MSEGSDTETAPAHPVTFTSTIPRTANQIKSSQVHETLPSLLVIDNHLKKKRSRDEVSPYQKRKHHTKERSNSTGSSNPPLTATHEIRRLRSEVSTMEARLLQLETNWSNTIRHNGMLTIACHAAKEKWATTQVEQVNAELKDQLVQQQFILASLQSALLQAPLQSSGREIYEAVHINTVLTTDKDARLQQLHAHCDQGLNVAIEAVNRFTQNLGHTSTPFSQSSVTGGIDHTFISNVFVLEIPHPSLKDVYHSAITYFATLHNELRRHTATTVDVSLLADLGKKRQYVNVKLANNHFRACANIAFSAGIVDGVGVMHHDNILNDPCSPTAAHTTVDYLCSYALTVTPITDAQTGQVKMVVRRLVVFRYGLLPHNPIVQEDMKRVECVLNGDLLTAVMCQTLSLRRPERPMEERRANEEQPVTKE